MRASAAPRGSYLRFAAFGLVGVGLGHFVEYVLFFTGHGTKHSVLAYTGGKDYLAAAAATGVMVVLLAIAATLVPAIQRGLAARPGTCRLPAPAGLAIGQALAFSAFEVGERLLAAGRLPGLVPVLAIGLPLQVLIGWGLTRFIAGISRLGERVGAMIAGARGRTPSGTSRVPAPRSWPSWSLFAALRPTRGPPSFRSSTLS